MRQMKEVRVNGGMWKNFDGKREFIELEPIMDWCQIMVRY
jgi:hypothetical protein